MIFNLDAYSAPFRIKDYLKRTDADVARANIDWSAVILHKHAYRFVPMFRNILNSSVFTSDIVSSLFDNVDYKMIKMLSPHITSSHLDESWISVKKCMTGRPRFRKLLDGVLSKNAKFDLLSLDEPVCTPIDLSLLSIANWPRLSNASVALSRLEYFCNIRLEADFIQVVDQLSTEMMTIHPRMAVHMITTREILESDRFPFHLFTPEIMDYRNMAVKSCWFGLFCHIDYPNFLPKFIHCVNHGTGIHYAKKILTWACHTDADMLSQVLNVIDKTEVVESLRYHISTHIGGCVQWYNNDVVQEFINLCIKTMSPSPITKILYRGANSLEYDSFVKLVRVLKNSCNFIPLDDNSHEFKNIINQLKPEYRDHIRKFMKIPARRIHHDIKHTRFIVGDDVFEACKSGTGITVDDINTVNIGLIFHPYSKICLIIKDQLTDDNLENTVRIVNILRKREDFETGADDEVINEILKYPNVSRCGKCDKVIMNDNCLSCNKKTRLN